ncbi:hypothetical protein, partial [Pseudoalteromonas fuliginea]
MPNLSNTTTATILPQILECNALTGLENHGKVYKGEVNLCEATGASDFGIEIKNYGTNAITSAQVSLMDGETVVATQDFSGNLAAYATGSVEFTDVTLDTSIDYT